MKEGVPSLVIAIVAVAAFAGLLIGWAMGAVGDGPVGVTATTGFVVLALFVLAILIVFSLNRVRGPGGAD